MKKFSIVIPTYNEKLNIPILFNKLNEVEASVHNKYEMWVIFVDDNSPDGTAELIETTADKLNFNIRIVKRKAKLGLGTAYIAGFKLAIKLGMDFVIQMDADLSHDPHTVPLMVQTLETKDFVIGSRYIKGGKLPKWSIVRKLVSTCGNLYSRIILGFDIHDYTGGFNGYRTTVLKKLNFDEIKSNGYSFQIEMKYRLKRKGCTFGEIPIQFFDRLEGKSKFSKNIFFEAFFNTLRLKLEVRN